MFPDSEEGIPYLLEFGDLLLGEEDEDGRWGLLGLAGG